MSTPEPPAGWVIVAQDPTYTAKRGQFYYSPVINQWVEITHTRSMKFTMSDYGRGYRFARKV